ncbi:MAG: hypothetical protein PVH61_09465 [Candidatus Aminicenantes bacterium]|jgi:hypothetical protein
MLDNSIESTNIFQKRIHAKIIEKNNTENNRKLIEEYLRRRVISMLIDDDPVRGIYAMYGAHYEDVRYELY